MKYLLNGIWDAECIFPQDGHKLSMKATVPGNCELDLYNAGIEPEPYWSTNEYLYQKYEVCDWEYKRTFNLPDEMKDGKVKVVFEGLNCIADIYMDGALIGKSDNALIPHEFGFDAARKTEHTLLVHIHSALLYARNKELPVSVSAGEKTDEFAALRMPPHSFGWDIMPRFLSAGMWRDVYVESVAPAGFSEVYYTTISISDSRASVLCRFRIYTGDYLLDNYKIRVFVDGKKVVGKGIHFVSNDCSFDIENPRLWWPLGYGEQYLYCLRIELVKDETVLDSREERFGIRKVELVHKMAAGDAGEFLIKVNGCPILCKGSNWVPLDALHSRDTERIQKTVDLFRECGCNIVRMWGGNVYENDEVYRLLDEYGIMVWQDFAMACAVYPQGDDMAESIEKEAKSVVRRLRNHPCIILWAGDNEVDETYFWRGIPYSENRYNAITREVLPKVIRENDPYRKFLPSSPFIDGNVAKDQIPEQHLWGPRAYYKDDYYKNTAAHFVSECGYHGCPSVESIRKFIPEEELNDMTGPSWAAHNSDYQLFNKRGYDRNGLMSDQVEMMIGTVPKELDEFALMSQFTQAEAKKFFVERTRLKKWRRTGIIWWNMIDGWPQTSDSVVDWYYVKKRAFDTIKRVQTPICVIMDEQNGWNQDLYICNDSRESKNAYVKVSDADSGEILFEGDVFSPANENKRIFSRRVIPGRKQLLLIGWVIDGVSYKNHYLNGFPPFNKEDIKRWIPLIDEE